MAKRSYTVGVIGLGFGRSHIPAFQVNGCKVVAVCQRNRAQAQAIADMYGVPGVHERWEELLEQARPEIVVIATPPHLHKPIALAALDALRKRGLYSGDTALTNCILEPEFDRIDTKCDR